MIAHSIQLSELLPDFFVKIIFNTGVHKYCFIQNSFSCEDQLLVVSKTTADDSFSEMVFETIDTKTVASIDPYMK